MIRRAICKEFDQCLVESPAVAITGARQSGKTTLAKARCPDHAYFSFEDPLTKEFFLSDPLGFLYRCGDGAIFDEAQQVPDL